MGVGLSLRESQCERVRCMECLNDLALGSLVVHRQTGHDTGRSPSGIKPHLHQTP